MDLFKDYRMKSPKFERLQGEIPSILMGMAFSPPWAWKISFLPTLGGENAPFDNQKFLIN